MSSFTVVTLDAIGHENAHDETVVVESSGRPLPTGISGIAEMPDVETAEEQEAFRCCATGKIIGDRG
jgi:hypothetical protein